MPSATRARKFAGAVKESLVKHLDDSKRQHQIAVQNSFGRVVLPNALDHNTQTREQSERGNGFSPPPAILQTGSPASSEGITFTSLYCSVRFVRRGLKLDL
jgi:hypothetical protein